MCGISGGIGGGWISGGDIVLGLVVGTLWWILIDGVVYMAAVTPCNVRPGLRAVRASVLSTLKNPLNPLTDPQNFRN